MNARWHRWLGLWLGGLLLVSALSALGLAGFSSYEQWQVRGAEQSSAAVVAQLQQKLPELERLERTANGLLQVTYTEQGESLTARYDAQNARLMPQEPRSALQRTLHRIHREFLLGSAGRWLALTSALLLMLLSITGWQRLCAQPGGWRAALAGQAAGSRLARAHSRWALLSLPLLLLLSLSGLYLGAVSQGWLDDGQSVELAPLSSTSTSVLKVEGGANVLANLPVSQLRELEFPSSAQPYYRLRTETGEGFVDPRSDQWLSYQPLSWQGRLYQTLYALHTGSAMPLWTTLLAAACAALLWLCGSGLWLRLANRPQRLPGNASADQAQWVILVGSQGGTTWAVARQLFTQLKAHGLRVRCAAMNEWQAYPKAQQLLLLTSTYGEGAAPESAQQFLPRLAKQPLPQDCKVALLGFGDSRFNEFCGYAREVARQLEQQQVRYLLPLTCIDRDQQPALTQWAEQLSARSGMALQLQLAAAAPGELWRFKVLSRELCVEPGNSSAVILRLRWLRKGLRRPSFAPGDLLAISPDAQQAARFYSIASSHEEGYLEICVRLREGGLCSSYLHQLAVGDELQGGIVAHPEFRPNSGEQPLLLVGAGTGLAPLLGLVRKNARRRPIHLYWGGRTEQSDFLYAKPLRECLADGRLSQLRLAFSRSAPPRYVQGRLAEDAQRLPSLLAQGAQVVVCGSPAMAQGVRQIFDQLLAPLGSSVRQLKEQRRYREDIY